MKSKILILIFSILFTFSAYSQVDRSKMPEPGPAPEIQIGDYESFELDNGLKVFVVENETLPSITVRLVIDRDPILEGAAAGYVQTAGELLRRGTKTRTKAQLDEEIDFIGANIFASSSSVYGSALKKHREKLFELFADIVLNPNFTQEELDKIIKQTLSGLASQKDSPSAIANNVRKVLDYGDEHPYGEITTEESVKKITLEMCKEYYKTYFKPNVAYLAIVGDISIDDARELVEKYFSSWEKKDVPTFEYKTPKAPLVRKAAIVDRPNSVQSVVNIIYPINLKRGSADEIKAKVANHILGGSGSARLFMNLREDKAYTYGAYSSIGADKLVGNFRANCEVRNEVTDSSITEIINEMKRMRTEKVSEEELEAAKKNLIGSFARSLESPQTIAEFALNIQLYDLPNDYYKNYLKNLNAVSVDDIQKIAKKYINPKKAYVLVVGKAEEVAGKLKKFSLSGKLDYYDMYGKTYDPNVSKVPEGLTVEKVFDNYLEAIGGKDKYLSIQDQTMVMKGTVQGMDLSLTISQKAPNKYYQFLDAGVFQQKTVFDGEKGFQEQMGQRTELEGDQLESTKIQAQMFMYVDYDKLGINAELKGVEKVVGKDAYKVMLTLPSEDIWTQYFSVETGLLIRQLTPVSTPQGEFNSEINFADYKEIDGMKFPQKISQQMGPQSVSFTLDKVEINSGLSDDLFKVD